jgi:hypothetical protein
MDIFFLPTSLLNLKVILEVISNLFKSIGNPVTNIFAGNVTDYSYSCFIPLHVIRYSPTLLPMQGFVLSD